MSRENEPAQLEDGGEHAHTNEEHQFIITKPDPKNEQVQVRDVVEDIVQPEGYVKRSTTTILQSSCCGSLTSFNQDMRYKPPAGRCPTCNGLVCHGCSEDIRSCQAGCGARCCPACQRQVLNTDLVLCPSCFTKHATGRQEHELRKCLDGNSLQG